MFWRALAYGSVGVALLAFARLAGDATYEPWDIALMLIASQPFLCIVALSAMAIRPAPHRLSQRSPHPLAAVIGALMIGVVFAYLLFMLLMSLGYFPRQFSAPIIPMGFVSAVIVSVAVFFPATAMRFAQKSIVHGFLLLVLAFGVYGMNWSAGYGSEDQTLTLAFFRYVPNYRSLSIEDRFQMLSSEDRSVLEGRLETGRLIGEGSISSGYGPPAKAIVVLHEPVTEVMQLAPPRRNVVFYLQDNGSMTQIGSTASEGRFLLHPESTGAAITQARIGGTTVLAIKWPNHRLDDADQPLRQRIQPPVAPR